MSELESEKVREVKTERERVCVCVCVCVCEKGTETQREIERGEEKVEGREKERQMEYILRAALRKTSAMIF